MWVCTAIRRNQGATSQPCVLNILPDRTHYKNIYILIISTYAKNDNSILQIDCRNIWRVFSIYWVEPFCFEHLFIWQFYPQRQRQLIIYHASQTVIVEMSSKRKKQSFLPEGESKTNCLFQVMMYFGTHDKDFTGFTGDVINFEMFTCFLEFLWQNSEVKRQPIRLFRVYYPTL